MKRFLLISTILLANASIASVQISGADLLKKMSYPADSKLLILHSDDLGMSHSAQNGIKLIRWKDVATALGASRNSTAH